MVIAYPVRGKAKSLSICTAFADGCGGEVSRSNFFDRNRPAFFYGVDNTNMDAWQEVIETGMDYFYCDNSYFDDARQVYFRVTKNALQHSGIGDSTCERFETLGIPIATWKLDGVGSNWPILMCPQSGHFMSSIARIDYDWLTLTRNAIREITRRQINVREWSPDKAKLGRSLKEDLNTAHCLVTWSSAAAITAILAGVPAVSMGPSAAGPMCGQLSQIESGLPTPSQAARQSWAGVLADNQFTLSEMRSGDAWQVLNS